MLFSQFRYVGLHIYTKTDILKRLPYVKGAVLLTLNFIPRAFPKRDFPVLLPPFRRFPRRFRRLRI